MNPTTARKLGQLAEPLRSRVAQLLAAAGDQVWIVSGRRTMDEQIQLRRAHCGTTWADIWTKRASECHPATAIPGTSLHETGRAVDLGGNLALAEQLGGRLGLATPVPGEAWHFEVSGGSAAYLAGGDFPTPGDIFEGAKDKAGDLLDSLFPDEVLGDVAGGLTKSLGKLAVTSVLLAGGVALIVLGGVRGTK